MITLIKALTAALAVTVAGLALGQVLDLNLDYSSGWFACGAFLMMLERN